MSEELVKNLTHVVCGVVSGRPFWSAKEVADAIRAALSRPAPVQVPEGWKLVPIRATDEMLDNASKAACCSRGDANRVWISMLSLAPFGAVAQGGGVDVEKVMGLVKEYGEQCEAEGYLERSGSQDAAKKLRESAYQKAVKIRALLTPAGDGWPAVGDRMPLEQQELFHE